MTDSAEREHAALDVLELLPDRWALGPTSYDPGTGRWCTPLVARIPVEAASRLDERRRYEKLAEIDRRGRAAFLEGAEERSKDG